MQPELPTSSPENERLPATSEQQPEGGMRADSPEYRGERGSEQSERRAEAAARVSETYRQAQATASPLPTVVSTGRPVDDDDDIPAVAADEDLIEKEWVDKAKKIISATQDDPAQREREVAKLQADYLRKRYGREIGLTE